MPSKPQVINSGVNGNNSRDLLLRMERDCLTHHPDLVIIMIGTNDMNTRFYVPVDEFEKNLDTIVKKITVSGSRILILNQIPVYEPYLFLRHDPAFYGEEGHSGRLKEMNEVILKIAVANNTGFIDLHHIFESVGHIGTDAESWLQNEINSSNKDGHHPTPDGYRAIALTVYEYVQFHYPEIKKIVCFGDSITNGDGVPGGKNYPSYLQNLLTPHS